MHMKNCGQSARRTDRYRLNNICIPLPPNVYLQVKKSRSSRGNDSRTADVRTVFTPDERTLPDNTTEKGHWCEVCK